MPTNNVQALLSADIPDPTDFPTTDLRQLDANLRCTICSELYDAPITIACGHCFCSLCIRAHITKEPECPSCRKPTAEAHFRLNPALEEANVLRLSREDQQRAIDRAHLSNQTPRRLRTPAANGRKRKRPGASESSGSDIVCVAGPSNSNASSEIAESSPLQAQSKWNASRRRENIEPSSDPEEAFQLGRPDSMVECPICGKFVEYQFINNHMDGRECSRKGISKVKNTSNSNAKAEWSKLLGKKPKKDKSKDNSDSDDALERLPKVSYAVLKDKALKDLLLTQKLPITGDRNTWITRHQRWVMIYNANLDKAGRRKTASELRTVLRKWEEDLRGPKHVVEDVAAHEAAHKDEFSRLVEEARRSRASKPPRLDDPSQDVLQAHINDSQAVVEDSEEEHL
ncbi:hypothetical protein BU15DRAFT_42358 [Melanogaster broomeanus]|nr:hypothetical protein BU15DRAFT_42358 [Melanogaster broomeanus]